MQAPKRTLILALFCALTAIGAAKAEDAAPSDPERLGPYPVGVTTTMLVDHSRTDALTGKPRSLMTEIWYPAVDESRGLPKNRLIDFFIKNQRPELAALLMGAFGVNLAEADARFQNHAVRDAQIRDGVFPLLLFSHGNGGLRMQNAFWCEHMASHGYIVMAPDHTGNCAVTFVDGEIVLFDATKEARTQSSVDRPKDLSFLIDAMDRMNKGNDSRFLGRVDMARIGAAGHSFGGFTCTWITNNEPRVRAVALMAGAAEERTNFDTPVMLLIATEDDTLGLETVQRLRTYFDASQGPRYSIEFKNAGHFSFTEMYQLKPDFGDGVGHGKRLANEEPITYISKELVHTLTNGYTTAFFGKHIKGLAGYDAYLAANRNADELNLRAEP